MTGRMIGRPMYRNLLIVAAGCVALGVVNGYWVFWVLALLLGVPGLIGAAVRDSGDLP